LAKQKSEIGQKNRKLAKKSEIDQKNRKLAKKIGNWPKKSEIGQKNRKLAKKSEIGQKIETWPKNRKFDKIIFVWCTI